MAVSVVMPALEIAQETGKVLKWLKREGQSVAKGEPLLEVETDKAVVEIEAPGDGILAGVRAHPGSEIPVGQIIAWLVRPGEAPPAETAAVQTGRRSDSASAQPAAASTAPASAPLSSAPGISPKARRLAQEHGVDLSRVRGSGPSGEILAADILAAAEAQKIIAPAATQGAVQALGAVGRLMAERTTQSWTSVPHFFLVREVNATGLQEALAKARPGAAQADAKPSMTDLLVQLVARTLPKHPRLNATWTAKGIRHNPQVNIGLAIAVDEGVGVGVISNADNASLAEIVAASRGLAKRAKAGKLTPADIAGATFTISNLGMYGVDAFTAIIVPPQAAILAVSRIADRVVAENGLPVVRPMLTLTLSSDHRVVDGARAAEFMRDLADALRDPRLS
jgi:pyruvate dehydrogenase E2 component (dihydrolipoamide acetyltransferase)